MPRCPNCGGTVADGDDFCQHCGAPLSADDARNDTQPSQTGGNESSSAPPPGDEPAGRPAGDESPAAQSPGGGPPGHRSGATGQQPPAGDDGGVSRRALLAGAGGGAVILAGGGYLAYTQFLGGAGDGPKGTIRRFFSALDDGDVQRANSLIHPDSPVGDVGSQTASQFASADISIEDLTLVSESGDRATVRIQLSFGNLGSRSLTYNLRRYQGEWRLYSAGSSGSGGGGNSAHSEAPQVSFSFEYQATGGGVGLLTITHSAGDTVRAGSLSLRGTGFSSAVPDGEADLRETGRWSDGDGDATRTYSPDEDITAGDSIVLGVAGDYDIHVVWESQSDDMSATLAEDRGPDA
ncbi:MAG: zinc-ribbon domain-containing protein [Haloarculaceae archaeon]